MAVVFPGRRTRMVLDIVCFIICFILVVGQMGLLDYYFIKYLQNDIWYTWIAGDVMVIFSLLICLVAAIKYNQRCMTEVCTSDANINYAFIAWFMYSMVLVGKIAVTFRLYYQEIDDNEWFGRHCFKLILSLSAFIFLFLVESHHYTSLNSPRQLYLTYLATSVTLDILDSIYFLELLWDPTVIAAKVGLPFEICILVFACVNFVLPTLALIKLKFKKMPHWLPLPYEKLYSLLYVLLVNLPYLVIRVWLWYIVPSHESSVFLVKNIIMVYLGIRELWVRLHLYRQRKATNGGQALESQQDNQAINHDEEEKINP